VQFGSGGPFGLFGDPFHALAQQLNPVRRQRKPYRMRMPPKAREQSTVFGVRCGKGVEQMKAMDGTAGAVRLAILVSDHQRGPAGAVDDAGGKDADHPPMPSLTGGGIVEHQACRQRSRANLVWPAMGINHCLDTAQRLSLARPSFVVQPVQLFSERSCIGGIAGQKQLDNVAGNVHPPGCVDARRQPKSHVCR
jgi:hypothetical protein